MTRKIVVATWRRMRPLQLLVEAERLLAELVERVLLGVAAQADAAAHVVELGEVLDPQAVDRAQQHEPLDLRPDLLAVLLLAGLELVVDELAQVLDELLADVAASSSSASDVPAPSMPIACSAADRPSRFHSLGRRAARGTGRPSRRPPSSRNSRTVSVRSSLRRTLSRSA